MNNNTYINGAKITIRRPSGQIETVVTRDHASNKGVIPAALFAKIVAANKAGGRGDVLSQEPNVCEFPREVNRMAIVSKIESGRDAFPGSKKWFEKEAAIAELKEFDAQTASALPATIATHRSNTAAGKRRETMYTIEKVNAMGGPEIQNRFGWAARVVLQSHRVNAKGDWRSDPDYKNSVRQYCDVANAAREAFSA